MARRAVEPVADSTPVRTRGTIKRLVTSKGFGFVADPQGLEYFFHGSACSCDFTDLKEGDPVTFAPTMAEKGPRAEQVERA